MAKKRALNIVPELERLEDRKLLDGTVTLVIAGDTLKIVGDRYNNDIIVRGPDQNGAYSVVSGNSQTTIVGDSSKAVKNISFKMGDGDDSVTIENLTLAGNLTIDGGKGLNTEALNHATLQSKLAISNAKSGTITATASSIQSDFIVRNGSSTSTDTVTLDGTTVGGQLKITSGNGPTQVDLINSSTVMGKIILRSGTGADTLSLGDGVSIGGLDINNGSGDSILTIGQAVTVNGAVRVVNGNGYDNVAFGDNSIFASSVYVSNGSGGSLTDLGLGVQFGADLSLLSGKGYDEIQGKGGHVLGKALISLGSGGSLVNSDQLLVEQNLKLVSTGGADQVVMTRTHVTGNETITTGDGADSVQTDDGAVDGTTTINTGAGNDTISMDANDVYGTESHYRLAVKVNAGAGSDVMYVGGDTTNNGNIFVSMATFVGGAGNDRIEVGSENTVEYDIKTMAEVVLEPTLTPIPV